MMNYNSTHLEITDPRWRDPVINFDRTASAPALMMPARPLAVKKSGRRPPPPEDPPLAETLPASPVSVMQMSDESQDFDPCHVMQP